MTDTQISPAQSQAAETFGASATAIEAQVGKVIVGQKELVRHTLITLLGRWQCLAGRRARPG